MKLPKTILRGYDKVTRKYVASALGIQVPTKKHKRGGRSMKLPMSALKKGQKDSKPAKKSGKLSMNLLKSKKQKNDNDGDE